MKKFLSILFLGILICLFGFLYVKYDNMSYALGYKCTFCNESLPYNLKPKFDFEYPQKFILLDEDDFELLGKGFKFYSNSFTINDFLAYGYNETSVLVKCTDSTNAMKYLISYETKYKNNKGNPEISFKDLSHSDFDKIKNSYKWFEVRKNISGKLKFIKLFLFIGILFSLFFLIKQLYGSLY